MTDDELSEFAEALADACERDGRVSESALHCPLAAATGKPGLCGAYDAAERLGVPPEFALNFTLGFDGLIAIDTEELDRKGFALGRLFRELYP